MPLSTLNIYYMYYYYSQIRQIRPKNTRNFHDEHDGVINWEHLTSMASVQGMATNLAEFTESGTTTK